MRFTLAASVLALAATTYAQSSADSNVIDVDSIISSAVGGNPAAQASISSALNDPAIQSQAAALTSGDPGLASSIASNAAALSTATDTAAAASSIASGISTAVSSASKSGSSASSRASQSLASGTGTSATGNVAPVNTGLGLMGAAAVGVAGIAFAL